ncbi:MAG TPA: MFS transporter [Solirubrobacteraceae bacterium]|jgi:CP family cyanate transporter-like MFS transporter|nr:MFS transporter [Solirubrobacteraceae bacterium]
MHRDRSLAAALLVVALNLRLAVAAVPPVLNQIRHTTGLSSAGGGLLTALPVFCFGLAALSTPWLIRRFGMGPALALALAALACGCALRLAPSVAMLFVGTAVIGAGIAVGNVLVPGLIKRDFGQRRVLMTALYSVALSGGAAISAGLTVPVEHALGIGWRLAITLWGAVALFGIVLWARHALRERERGGAGDLKPAGALWRDPLAWCVTAFMGLQSLGFYALLSWLPTILEDHGLSSATAGWLLSFSMFPSMLGAFLAPTLERRLGKPALMVALAVTLCAGAYLGLILDPRPGVYAWMTMLGLGQGSALGLALGYIVARAPDSHQAAHLSTMAQSVGYMIASSGPFLVGWLHGLSGSWTLPLVVLLAVLVPMLFAGLAASRNRVVLANQPV